MIIEGEREIGRLDVCIKVSDIKSSWDFYRRLGFVVVEGDIESFESESEEVRRWAVIANKVSNARIGLFQGYMEEDVLLNFRGADVPVLENELREKGLNPVEVKEVKEDKCGSFKLKDPDGNILFFDTAPSDLECE